MNNELKKNLYLLISLTDYLPKKVIDKLIHLFGIVWDTVDKVQSKKFVFLPPLELRIKVNTPNASSYNKYGQNFLMYFINLCNLKKTSRVLDVGCGTGILAVPLTTYLNKTGTYEGFDTNEKMVDWCKIHIYNQYPNFHFQTIDLYNGKYNPQGKIQPEKFKFPYKTGIFDLVVLSSVFTHMLPKDVGHYLKEITRVLKKGGRCLITYVLLNNHNDHLLNKKLSEVNFNHIFQNYRTLNSPHGNATYEDIVAYEESYIRNLYKEIRLNIDSIYYGSWSGRKKFLDAQDIVIAKKT